MAGPVIEIIKHVFRMNGNHTVYRVLLNKHDRNVIISLFSLF